MASQFASIGCNELYDNAVGAWVENGTKEPVMFVTTEQEIDEIQTLLLAFIAGVNETHIIYNNYEGDEYEEYCTLRKSFKKVRYILKNFQISH